MPGLVCIAGQVVPRKVYGESGFRRRGGNGNAQGASELHGSRCFSARDQDRLAHGDITPSAISVVYHTGDAAGRPSRTRPETSYIAGCTTTWAVTTCASRKHRSSGLVS